MALAASVGRGGANTRPDVKTVQVLLNLNGTDPARALDGRMGPATQLAIEVFQRGALAMNPPSSLVEPESPTLARAKFFLG